MNQIKEDNKIQVIIILIMIFVFITNLLGMNKIWDDEE